MEDKELLKQLANEIWNLIDVITEDDQDEIYQVRANIREFLSHKSMALILP